MSKTIHEFTETFLRELAKAQTLVEVDRLKFTLHSAPTVEAQVRLMARVESREREIKAS